MKYIILNSAKTFNRISMMNIAITKNNNRTFSDKRQTRRKPKSKTDLIMQQTRVIRRKWNSKGENNSKLSKRMASLLQRSEQNKKRPK